MSNKTDLTPTSGSEIPAGDAREGARYQRVSMPVDIFESDDELLIVADVPGVPADALELRLDPPQLHVEARQAPSDDRLGQAPLVYARSFRLPDTVAAGEVSAEVKRGVLRIHLPKAADSKPRRITVRAA